MACNPVTLLHREYSYDMYCTKIASDIKYDLCMWQHLALILLYHLLINFFCKCVYICVQKYSIMCSSGVYKGRGGICASSSRSFRPYLLFNFIKSAKKS